MNRLSDGLVHLEVERLGGRLLEAPFLHRKEIDARRKIDEQIVAAAVRGGVVADLGPLVSDGYARASNNGSGRIHNRAVDPTRSVLCKDQRAGEREHDQQRYCSQV